MRFHRSVMRIMRIVQVVLKVISEDFDCHPKLRLSFVIISEDFGY